MTNYEKISNRLKNENLIHDSYLFNKENRPNRSNEWRWNNRKCSVVEVLMDQISSFLLEFIYTKKYNRKLIV
jgi:hypothetical protein